MVTGAIKFFRRPYSLASDGATTNIDAAKNLLSFNELFYFEQDGQADITVFLSRTTNINRLLIVDTNAVSISVSNINNVTDQDMNDVTFPYVPVDKTSYFEFDKIEVNAVQVSLTPPNGEQLYCRQIIATEEIGTLEGFPRVSAFNFTNNEIKNKTNTGLIHITKQFKILQTLSLNLTAYPSQKDITLLEGLYNQPESFLIWPCGGSNGERYFNVNQEGWRLQDIYNVQTTGVSSKRYNKNYYKGGANNRYRFVEVL